MNNIILPKFLKPIYETGLIRIGKNNDGGYTIPKEALINTKLLFSFGIYDDFSFEKDFYKKTKAKIIAYDFEVSFKFFLKRFLLGNFKSLFDYIKHRAFFDGKDKICIQKYLAPIGTTGHAPLFAQNKITDVNLILKDFSSNNLFFKIDIEGSEYRILDQLTNQAHRMTGLVIEFHQCDLHKDKIKNFIEKFELQLVHIHVNNFGFINTNRFPTDLELTFSPSKFNKRITDYKKKFPISIDQPNNPIHQDLPIDFIE